jgi:hypothetical protein
MAGGSAKRPPPGGYNATRKSPKLVQGRSCHSKVVATIALSPLLLLEGVSILLYFS